MEEVSRGGHVGNLHVAVLVLALKLLGIGEDPRVLVGKLEVALNTSRRMLRTLTIITVGQRHDKAGTLHPLDLTRGDELVDDALRVVGKVTKLRLPHDEGVGGGQRIAVFEAKGTKLAQRRVGNDKLALVLADVLERGVGALILLVVENGVALRKGTTLDILAGNTDVVALGDERAKSKSLGSREINVLALNNSLGAVVENTLQVTVNMEALGSGANDLTNVVEALVVNVGVVVGENLRSELLGRLEAVPGGSSPLLGSGSVVLGLGKALLEHAPDPLLVLLDVLLGEGALLKQLVDVNVNLRRLLVDALVHQRLSE